MKQPRSSAVKQITKSTTHPLAPFFVLRFSFVYNNNNQFLHHTKEQSLHTLLLSLNHPPILSPSNPFDHHLLIRLPLLSQSTAGMTISPYYPRKQKTPVQRNSTLYKACTLALPVVQNKSEVKTRPTGSTVHTSPNNKNKNKKNRHDAMRMSGRTGYR